MKKPQPPKNQACFKNKYKSIEVPISRKLAKKVLVLPMYADMSKNELDKINKGCKADVVTNYGDIWKLTIGEQVYFVK